MGKVTPVSRVIPMNNNPKRKKPLPDKFKFTPPPDDAG